MNAAEIMQGDALFYLLAGGFALLLIVIAAQYISIRRTRDDTAVEFQRLAEIAESLAANQSNNSG